jgi:hypothetical protein
VECENVCVDEILAFPTSAVRLESIVGALSTLFRSDIFMYLYDSAIITFACKIQNFSHL